MTAPLRYDLHILQVATGLRKTMHDQSYPIDTRRGITEETLAYAYGDGDFSCDCNRNADFQRASGIPEDKIDWGIDADDELSGTEADRGRCGDERYAVKLVEHQTGRIIYQCPRWVEPT